MPGHRSIPLDCPHWTVLFSCTRFGGMPGYSLIDCIGLHTFGVSIMFYALWRHARLQIDSTGLPTLNASGVPYMHCSSTIKALFLSLPAFTSKGPPTFLVTGQAGPSPRTFRVLGDSKPVSSPSGGTEREAERDSEIAHIERLSCVNALEACQATDLLHGIAHMERFYCVLHALEACPATH